MVGFCSRANLSLLSGCRGGNCPALGDRHPTGSFPGAQGIELKQHDSLRGPSSVVMHKATDALCDAKFEYEAKLEGV